MNVTPQAVLRWAVGLIITAVVIAAVWYFRQVVVYILVSAVLAIMGRPLVNALTSIRCGRFAVPRWLASLVALMVIWGLLVALVWLVVPLLLGKVYELSQLDLHAVLTDVEGPLMHVQEFLSNILAIPEGQFSLSDVLVTTLRDALNYNTINTAFSSILELCMSAVVVFFSVSFITFFFMKEEQLFNTMVISVFPERYSENVARALNKVATLLSRYFTGLLIESIILLCVISLVLILFGMNVSTAIFIGAIMGILNVIPYAGPAIGGCVAMFIAIVSPISGVSIGHTVAIVVGTLMVVKAIDDFVIQPVLYSSRVKAHPLEVFIVILMAGYAWGIVGMFVAIPSYTVLRVFAKEFFSEWSLVRKLTEQV